GDHLAAVDAALGVDVVDPRTKAVVVDLGEDGAVVAREAGEGGDGDGVLGHARSGGGRSRRRSSGSRRRGPARRDVADTARAAGRARLAGGRTTRTGAGGARRAAAAGTGRRRRARLGLAGSPFGPAGVATRRSGLRRRPG